MKRLLPLLALLLLVVSAPVFGLDDKGSQRRSVIDDVIRMAQSGVPDDAIISFVAHTRDRFDATADDIIAMTNAHVSKDVIKAVIDEAADRKERPERTQRTYVRSEAYYGGGYYPYYSYYPYYPYYSYYNPFWYGPRLGVSVGFGFGRHFGGGFRGGIHRHH
jgi:hypothetical protein